MSEILRSDKLTPLHLRRTAVVYVRQSTPGQVENNKESTRLQYALADQARALGFTKVTVIDDDLGRSASGAVDRPGFDTLAGEVCTGEVGAIFCIEDSRLARNGREWHYLLDLCSMTGTLIIDPRGTYDPRLSNDRLMMGLKGSMAEFELSLFRQRSQAALLAKAKRGELRIPLPVGVCWTDDDKIELDPDLRVQSAIRTVFSKYTELGSVRQVLQWHRRGGVMVPTYSHDRHCRTPSWRLPSYQTIRGIITNPLYAGAYAFGRRETRTQLVDGHARKTEGHMKPRELWTVLIREHHPGYISWDCYERHQERLTENAHMHGQAGRKAGRGGRGLLAGVLRCRRCARMLSVVYKGASNAVPRYVCNLASRSTSASPSAGCARTKPWPPSCSARSMYMPSRQPFKRTTS